MSIPEQELLDEIQREMIATKKWSIITKWPGWQVDIHKNTQEEGAIDEYGSPENGESDLNIPFCEFTAVCFPETVYGSILAFSGSLEFVSQEILSIITGTQL